MRVQIDAYPTTSFGKLALLPGGVPFVFVAELEFPELFRQPGPWVKVGPRQYVHLADRHPTGSRNQTMYQVKTDDVRVRPVKLIY